MKLICAHDLISGTDSKVSLSDCLQGREGNDREETLSFLGIAVRVVVVDIGPLGN